MRAWRNTEPLFVALGATETCAPGATQKDLMRLPIECHLRVPFPVSFDGNVSRSFKEFQSPTFLVSGYSQFPQELGSERHWVVARILEPEPGQDAQNNQRDAVGLLRKGFKEFGREFVKLESLDFRPSRQLVLDWRLLSFPFQPYPGYVLFRHPKFFQVEIERVTHKRAITSSHIRSPRWSQ
jgi:hypothetical protein